MTPPTNPDPVIPPPSEADLAIAAALHAKLTEALKETE